MNLINRLTQVNSRLKKIPDRLGVPTYSTVVLVSSGLYTVLEPRPQVIAVTPRKAISYLAAGVEIFTDDREILGIPRSYPEELLSNARYLLNAVNTNGVWTGDKAECIFIDRSGLLEFKVLVRRMRAR